MLQQMRSRGWRQCLVLLLALAGMQQLAGAGLIKAKAWLAPVLIERAWLASLDNPGARVKPWPWADTWPVARLRVPAEGVDLLVLEGDSGNALAFGPGEHHGRVRTRSGSRFGHHDRGADFAVDDRLQPLILLILTCDPVEQNHIAVIRS